MTRSRRIILSREILEAEIRSKANPGDVFILGVQLAT
jgi:hypothetical protein